MVDLAKVKRNVAKMASMNAPEADIDGYIASEGVTIDDVRNYRETPQLQLTDEQKAQIQARNEAYAQRQEENRPWVDKNPVARLGVATMQGIANAGLNPAGYVARAAGIDTKPLEAQTAGERVAELAGQYGFDAAAIVPTLGLAAEAAPSVAPYVAPLVEGGVPLALTGSTGSALLTGMIDPENPYARMATDILGGGLGAGLTRPKFTAPKQDVKTVKELTKSIGEDALNRDMAEAERTGRNLLEVGGDEVMQAAQQARQQSPEARKIITDTLESSINEQPTRTRGVINEALGTKGKNATIAQVMENAKKEAQPLYKELEGIGDLAKYETRDLPQQNFNRWNAGNTIVDENGKSLDLYHGTLNDFDEFSKKMIGSRYTQDDNGFFFIDKENIAKDYATSEFDATRKGKVLPVKVRGKNTLKINSDWAKKNGLGSTVFDREDSISFWDNYHDFIMDEVKKAKADSVIIDDGTQKMVVAFEPNQIKSVNNSGAWSESPSLSDAGWTPESQSQLANAIKNNDVLADTISRVKRANSSLKNLPDTDFKVVNEARKALSQASMNRTELSGYEARQALNELDPILNNITGGKLAQANKLYSDAYQFERAADLGRDVFNSRKSPDDLKTAWNNLSSTEKQAAKIGLREEVMNKIGSATNEANALNRFLPENVREKIMTIAGNKEGGRIIDEAEQAVKLRRNYNKLTSGSQTSEKQSLRDTLRGIRGFIRNPWETTVDAIAKPFDTQRNIRMAEYLTENPTSLKDAFGRVNMANRLNAERMPRRTPYLQSALRAIIEENN